jgi:DmsE family decaheme c-type cytochrome
VPTITHRKNMMRVSTLGLMAAGLWALGMAGCHSPHQPQRYPEPNVEVAPPQSSPLYKQVCYQELRAQAPTVEGAEYVNDDELCETCHKDYVTSFAARNVHRAEGCEACHGPCSKHVETRGKEPGLVVSFKKGNPIVLAEACLRCHEENRCTEGAQWRRSKHAHCGVTCISCHRAHHEVPPGTPATTEPKSADLRRSRGDIALTSYGVHAMQPGQTASKNANLPSLRGTSNSLGAVAPGVCYRCHCDKADLQRVAGPHQICGPNGFNCTTCHDPHGHVRESSRTDLCLSCHSQGSPTMAWNSCTHSLKGVACTDCHNPHPRPTVQQVVGISHYQVAQPIRRAMSVQEPEVCYKCHPKIYAMNALPSHHPIKEGKMVCSDCHDPHGQRSGSLKTEGLNVNQLCYKCHMEKQGPFAYPHPPVTENCSYCHEPHGTVANNLLKQPTTFLCLRCHIGHRLTGHPSDGSASGPGSIEDIDRNQSIRQALYTDCTKCHAQIHGSDLPASILGRRPAPYSR